MVRRLVFSDVELDAVGSLHWLSYAWSRHGAHVEVDRAEVLQFIGMAAKVRFVGVEVGDVLTLSEGPFEGWRMRVTEKNSRNIKGVLLIAGREQSVVIAHN